MSCMIATMHGFPISSSAPFKDVDRATDPGQLCTVTCATIPETSVRGLLIRSASLLISHGFEQAIHDLSNSSPILNVQNSGRDDPAFVFPNENGNDKEEWKKGEGRRERSSS